MNKALVRILGETFFVDNPTVFPHQIILVNLREDKIYPRDNLNYVIPFPIVEDDYEFIMEKIC